MTYQRCLLEMGTGVDLHGKNYTKAAQRAVEDALRHCSLSFPRVFGTGAEAMHVEVTIGVQEPNEVEKDSVLSVLPYGEKHINVVAGGLNIPNDSGTDATVIANAAIIVSMNV
jgi:uncharacterized protein (TIGR02058 family)